MKRLYVTIGISGTGKSTYLKKHFDDRVIVCPDDIRKELLGDISNQSDQVIVWATATKRIKDTLDKYGEAVLDATNVNAKYRRGFLTPFKKPDIETIALVFTPDANISKTRVKKDVEKGKDRSEVPPNVIDKQLKDFNAGYRAIFQQFNKVKVIETKILLKNLILEIRNEKQRIR